MRNKKGFTLIELLSVIVLIGVILTIGIFTCIRIRENILAKQYKNLKTEIELAGQNYYVDTESTTFFVKTLIDEGYLKANSNMDIIDPRDGKSLKCQILSVNEQDKVILNYQKDSNCSSPLEENYDLKIKLENAPLEDIWYNHPITLMVDAFGKNIDSFTWTTDLNPNTVNNDIKFDLTNLYNERGNVINDVFYVNGYENASGKVLKSKGEKVKIDGVFPVIENVEIINNDIWTKEKEIRLSLKDIGSGIYSYIISNSPCNDDYKNWPKKFYKNENEVKHSYIVTKETDYYLCVADKAGNITKYDKTLSVQKIDNIAPQCDYIGSNVWLNNNKDLMFGCHDNESGCEVKIKLNGGYEKVIEKNNNVYAVKTFSKTATKERIKDTIGSFIIYDKAGNNQTCPINVTDKIDVYIDNEKPKISNERVNGTLNYNNNVINVTFTVKDNHSGMNSYYAGYNMYNYPNDYEFISINNCQKNGDSYLCTKQITLPSENGSGQTFNINIFAKDNVSNIQKKDVTYILYNACSDTILKSYPGVCQCSPLFGYGQIIINYEKYSTFDNRYCGNAEPTYIPCTCVNPEPTPTPTPEPEPSPNPGVSCEYTDTSLRGNRCNTVEDVLYYILSCQPSSCGKLCKYTARDGHGVSGTIEKSILTNPQKCSKYGNGGGSGSGGSNTGGNNNCPTGYYNNKVQCETVEMGKKCCKSSNGLWAPKS